MYTRDPIKAPLALFFYDRPKSAKKLLSQVSNLADVENRYIYAFIDGHKNNNKAEVKKTRDIVEQYKDSIIIRASKQNLGLQRAILNGVNTVLQHHENVIVIEDDLILGEYALDYFDKYLAEYKYESSVYGICGYLDKSFIKSPVLLPMSHPWGWATWRDKWPDDLIKNYSSAEISCNLSNINVGGLRNFGRMYNFASKKQINSWWIYWHLHIVLKKGYCIFPHQTHIQNEGFTTYSGTNSSALNPLRLSYIPPTLSNTMTLGTPNREQGKLVLEKMRHSHNYRILRIIDWLGGVKRRLKFWK